MNDSSHQSPANRAPNDASRLKQLIHTFKLVSQHQTGRLDTLPERILSPLKLKSWLRASMLLGFAPYVFLLLLIIVQREAPQFFDARRIWYYRLFPSVLVIYILLIYPIIQHWLNHILGQMQALLPSPEVYNRLCLQVRQFNQRQEIFVFWLGLVFGLLVLQPWQQSIFALDWLWSLSAYGLLYGLLSWLLYYVIVTTRELAEALSLAQSLRVLQQGVLSPMLRWSLGLLFLFFGGIFLAILFMRPGNIFTSDRLLLNSIVLLSLVTIFLQSGISRKFLAEFRILRTLILLATLILVGTFGYHRLEGWTLLDGLYMTIITMTTIGYGEIKPLSEFGRIFTIFLGLASVGIGGYAISTMAAFIVEGDFQRLLRGSKMDKEIAKLKDHIILCGVGSVGNQIASELFKTGTPFVAVDADESALSHLQRLGDVLCITGDATTDEPLRLAGVERAKGLIVALRDDKDNAFVILSARTLNPNLRIVARLVEEENAEKLRRVGADEIVSPDNIGGMRMASVMIRPTVVTFLDEMLNVSGQTLRIEEIHLEANSAFVGKTLGQADINRKTGLLVVAIRRQAGDYHFTPQADTLLQAQDTLIVMGHMEQVYTFRQLNAG